MISPKYSWITFFICFSFLANGQQHTDQPIDSTISSVKTVRIQGRTYVGFTKLDSFYLVDGKGHVLIRAYDHYFGFRFEDFNRDGYPDLKLIYSCNTPEVMDLFIFMPAAHKFTKIRNFDAFPEPIRIKGTHYFYSYHHSGCADMNWDSDLFYIHNGKAIALGNIQGLQCEDREEKDGVYIHRIREGKNTLITTLPIQQIGKYKDYKWGFIYAYWTKHYKRFI